MEYKDVLGTIAVVVGLVGYVPYLLGMYRGQVHPHIFSWLIWTVLTAIIFALQLADEAGPGAWITGFTAIVCAGITIWSLRVGEKRITRGDWAALGVALAAIPVWLLAEQPALATLLVTAIDALAFWPTVRKSWWRPWDEALSEYWAASIKFAIALAALDHIGFVSAFYPAALVVMHLGFIVMAVARRRVLAPGAPDVT